MTAREAFEILNGAELMVLNRDFDQFHEAITVALVALQNKAKREGGKKK